MLARSGEALAALDARLRSVYLSDGVAYFDEAEKSDKRSFYEIIKPALSALIAERVHIRALEFGAGRTRFSQWLKEIGRRDAIHFTAQDVTPTNRDYLAEQCDDVIVGELTDVNLQFDFIFSTFVYEHLVYPKATIGHCLRILRPGGILFIVSPQYTMPGYIPPALRHLPRWKQIGANAFLVLSSLLAKLTRRPQFWIAKEPAVFSRPFRRDYDAVHMVSKGDLDSFTRTSCEPVAITLPKSGGWRGYVWLRFAMLIAAYRKR